MFTQEQYDEVYGRGTEDTPLVQTMKQIFSGKTVLFLGCSLASDRVLDVLKRCCANHAYLYKIRHLVENAFLWLKRWRGIATRYAKNTSSFLSAVHIRCIAIWLAVLA